MLVSPLDLSSSTNEVFFAAINSPALAQKKAKKRNRKLAALKAFLRWLEGSGIPPRANPDSFASQQSLKSSASAFGIPSLSSEQCRELLDSALDSDSFDSVRNHAIIYSLLTIPIRRAPFSSLNVEDLNLEADVPWVSVRRSRGGLALRFTIPLDTVNTLQRYLHHYGIGAGPLWRSHSRRNPGGRLTPTSIYRIVRDTALAAGLPEIGAHTLRHTGCTLAIDNGASLQQVQSHARHKQIETTMVYVHQRDRLRDSAADFIKLDEPDRS